MLETIFRGVQFKMEILKAIRTSKVTKIERYEKNYEIENSAHIKMQKFYFINFFHTFQFL